MAVAQLTVLPFGTGASISKYVAGAVRIVAESGLKYELTAMTTVVEGDVDSILALMKKVHESAFEGGAARVLTSLSIDERRDKELTIESKKRAVKEKLQG
ncbi:MAG: MTH1187 family thiamine-binding protein [bacterium]|jgi:uncharacterized protein (TIGR00106 family)